MDEGIYLELGRHLAEAGRLYLDSAAFATVGPGETTLFWTPFYPTLLAAFHGAGIDPARGAAWTQIAMASLLPLLMWPAASRLLRGRWLWGFLILAAVYPYPFQLATQVASESSAQFLALACLALAVSDPLRAPWRAGLLGTAAAWLCLDRPEFLLFAACILAWTAARALPDLRGTPRARLGLIVLAISFAAWTAPWLYRNHGVTGAWIFTTRSGYSLAYQNEYLHRHARGELAGEAEWAREFPALPREIERHAWLKARARSWILANPGAYAGLCLKRAASFALPQEAKRLIYALAGRKDIKGGGLPPWYRFANAVFLALFWAGLGYAAVRLARGARMRLPDPGSVEGLLLLVAAGQLAVYVLLAYIEYQRSMLDPIFLMILAWACARLREAPAAAR